LIIRAAISFTRIRRLLIRAGDAVCSFHVRLTCSRFADTLTGDGQANRLTGGPGTDLLTGGPSNDHFVLNIVSDSAPGSGRDQIIDFDAGDAVTSVDVINLSSPQA
jgi:Ca2+-binding RTX toxin-like protein